MAFEIAKAGWLFRQSTILHRWKRNWFVLYLDGTLRFFENPDSHTAEEAHSIHGHCIRILTGDQVVDVTPPDGGYSRSCLLRIEFRESTLTLCAESKDDMKAWQVALEQARVAQVGSRPRSAPPPYSCNGAPPAYAPPPYDYYQNDQAGYYPGHQTMYAGQQLPAGYLASPQGNTTIILQDDPYYRRGYYGGDGGDFAMGALTGAAVGSMMMSPMLWGPYLWF